jgi:hypothetical protein
MPKGLSAYQQAEYAEMTGLETKLRELWEWFEKLRALAQLEGK